MRKLALSRHPWERAFAARMIRIFRVAAEILEEIAALYCREAIEAQAAGEEFGQALEDCACGVLDPDGEVLDLDELTAEQREILSWALV